MDWKQEVAGGYDNNYHSFEPSTELKERKQTLTEEVVWLPGRLIVVFGAI